MKSRYYSNDWMVKETECYIEFHEDGIGTIYGMRMDVADTVEWEDDAQQLDIDPDAEEEQLEAVIKYLVVRADLKETWTNVKPLAMEILGAQYQLFN